MKSSPPDDDALFAPFLALGPLRVWSVIITIFGDSVGPRGGTVPASALAEIGGRIGIGHAALRVALHRLTRDGWLSRDRRGRRSYYALSSRGTDEFGPATRRIYAPAPALSGPWTLAVTDPGLSHPEREAAETALKKAGYLPAGASLWLGPGGCGPAPGEVFTIEGTPGRVPGWLAGALTPPDLARDYADLFAALETTRAALQGTDPGPLDAIALRTLIVHRWRRLLLRHADLPRVFLPEGWRGEDCRALVLDLHAALRPAAEAWLDQAFEGAAAGTSARK